MSVLKDLQEAIALRMRIQSSGVLKTLQQAEACIVFLHKQGCTVQNVTVRPDYAVIEIDPPSGKWLRGAIHITRVNRLVREVTKVAKVHGCQVNWTEREAHPLLQREG